LKFFRHLTEFFEFIFRPIDREQSSGLDFEAFTNNFEFLELFGRQVPDCDSPLRSNLQDSFLLQPPQGLGDGDDGHLEFGGEFSQRPVIVYGKFFGDNHLAEDGVGLLTFS